jgi:hypothetical protein
MTKIGTLSNTMRILLMVTVLTPAPLLAEPATTARQMLGRAQTQAQDHALKGEVQKIAERGRILTETPAVTFFSSNLQQPDAIPAVTASAAEIKIDPPSQQTPSALRDDSISVTQASTADPKPVSRAPAYQVASLSPSETAQGQIGTSSIVTSPAPTTAADTTSAAPPVAAAIAGATTSLDTPAVAPAAVAQPTAINTALAKTETPATEGNTILPSKETKSETVASKSETSEAAVRSTAKKTTASTRIANSSPVTHQRHARANAAVEFADSEFRPQLQRIINRPEVRSLMAQYGLN